MTFISIQRFGQSLRHAGRGFRRAVTTENSFRIHVAAAAVVSVLLLFSKLSPVETALVVMVMAMVLVMELINTIVERFVGLLEPRVHPYVGIIKDFMAAAVLVTTVGAVIVAGLLIVPAFWR